MRELPRPGELVVPDRISATQVSVAGKCLLRFVWDQVSSDALPSASPARYVGLASHRVIEAARRGAVGNPPDRRRLELEWDREVAAVEADAERNGDLDWLPLAQHWSTLERTRLRTIHVAVRQRVSAGQGSGVGRTEVDLKTRDGSVVGRVDAVDVVEGKTCLRDFKSGLVAEKGSQAVKSDYVEQLQLYAALYRDTTGAWPDQLEVVDRSGKTWSVDTTPAEAEEQLARARSLLGRAVELTGSGLPQALKMKQLASLEEDACRSCSHRPTCPAYLGRLGEESIVPLGPSDFAPLDVQGVVESIQRTEAGRLRLALSCRDRRAVIGTFGADGEGVRDPAKGVGEDDPLSVGSTVAVFGTRPMRSIASMGENVRLVVEPGCRAYLVGGK